MWVFLAILAPFRLFHRFMTVDNRSFVAEALSIMLLRWFWVGASTVVAAMNVMVTRILLESDLLTSIKGVVILWEIWMPIWVPFYLMRTPQLRRFIDWIAAEAMSMFDHSVASI